MIKKAIFCRFSEQVASSSLTLDPCVVFRLKKRLEINLMKLTTGDLRINHADNIFWLWSLTRDTP